MEIELGARAVDCIIIGLARGMYTPGTKPYPPRTTPTCHLLEDCVREGRSTGSHPSLPKYMGVLDGRAPQLRAHRGVFNRKRRIV